MIYLNFKIQGRKSYIQIFKSFDPSKSDFANNFEISHGNISYANIFISDQFVKLEIHSWVRKLVQLQSKPISS